MLRVALIPQASVELLARLLEKAEREAWAAEREVQAARSEVGGIQRRLGEMGRTLGRLEECVAEFGRGTAGLREVQKRVVQVREEREKLVKEYEEKVRVVEGDGWGEAKRRVGLLRDMIDGLL